MKGFFRILLLILFVGTASTCLAGSWESYTVYDTVPIKNGVNKKKLMKDIEKWFDKERGQGLVRKNTDNYILQGKGLFVYYNYVKVEDMFLSPRANERTAGNIMFVIKVSILDSVVIAECTNFTHEAYYSQYGKISFGALSAYENVPPGRCMESKKWCAAVWKDMKERSYANVKDRFSRLVPDSYIRKKGKSFKLEEEEVVQDTTPEKDPKDYLKIENYLIYDEEE